MKKCLALIMILCLTATGAFAGTVILPESLTEIRDQAFKGDTSLDAVVLDDSVTTIGKEAFADSSLRMISFPEKITSIEKDAFDGCENLTTVVVYENTYAHTYFKDMEGIAIEFASDEVNEDFLGAWTYIGVMEYGSFIDLTGIDYSETYTFKEDGAVDYINTGNYKTRGTWGVSGGATTITIDGRTSSMIRMENGALLIGSYLTGEVFSRDGKVPAIKTVKPGMTENGFKYEQLSDGTLKITGHDTNDIEILWDDETGEEYIVYEGERMTLSEAAVYLPIPSEIDGVKVTQVANYAFRNNRLLRAALVPEGVVYIGREAFSECFAMETVTLPSTLNSMGSYAFGSCEKLNGITIPESLQSVQNNPFSRCHSLKEFTISDTHKYFKLEGNALVHKASSTLTSFPAGNSAASYAVPGYIREIESNAFEGCQNITSVTLPEGLLKIGNYAFEYSGLKSITLPASLNDMGSNPFLTCFDLESVNVASGNQRYYSNDGVLFDKETSGLFYYPIGKTDVTYTVPEGTKVIAEDAFARNRHMVNLIVSDTVETIENYAFYAMKELANITIPESVTSLGAYAFGECAKITSVTLPRSITEVRGYTFCDTSLQQLNVVKGTTIAETAFDECRNEVEIIYYE